MEEYKSLLNDLKENDKIRFNVLYMIAESNRHQPTEISKAIIEHLEKTGPNGPVQKLKEKLVLLDEYKTAFQDLYKPDLPIPVEMYFYNEIGKNEYFKCYKKFNYSRMVPTDWKTNDQNMSPNIGKRILNIENVSKRHKKDDTIKQLLPSNNCFSDSFFGILQCKICGLRFSEGEGDLLGTHVNDHSRRNRLAYEKNVLSREYYPFREYWIKCLDKIKLDESIPAEDNKIFCDESVYCDKCENKMEMVWDDDAEKWVLINAVKLKEGSYCHRNCVI
ncbi:Pre-mRNA cleavage complex 2 protein Pcf11 [Astathelohania contejeani]|uniref:Pre-mRNA cleavage complex 2 protein Pcf11 n=1 Tax=Astathelohania contejeani TaxID=164912 RepID=A0ABQ7I189_9MICR|nr:Pre-mRNA cleavage complex 2 protein Pcf11 [Thelohania contejeani]